MPYPNEHAARVREPSSFAKVRRENDAMGKGVDVIWGVRDDGSTEIQAIRFDSGKFSPAQAKDWLKEHDVSPIDFEPAKGEGKSLAFAGLKTKNNSKENDMAKPKYFHVVSEAKSINREERTMEVIMTTIDRDRQGDVVDPLGLDLKAFIETGGPVLWNHNQDQHPIGQVLEIKVLDDKLVAKVRFASTEEAIKTFEQYADDFMRCWSIGFIPKSIEPIPADEETGAPKGFLVKQAEMVELSATPISANVYARTKGLRVMEGPNQDVSIERDGDTTYLVLTTANEYDPTKPYVDKIKLSPEDKKRMGLGGETSTGSDVTTTMPMVKRMAVCGECGYSMDIGKSDEEGNTMVCPKCGAKMRWGSKGKEGEKEEKSYSFVRGAFDKTFREKCAAGVPVLRTGVDWAVSGEDRTVCAKALVTWEPMREVDGEVREARVVSVALQPLPETVDMSKDATIKRLSDEITQKAGREISAKNREKLQALLDKIGSAWDELEGMLAPSKGESKDDEMADAISTASLNATRARARAAIAMSI